MPLRVLKPFNSTTRRFNVGDELPDNEDLSPHTFEGAKAAGLIAWAPVPKVAAKSADE